MGGLVFRSNGRNISFKDPIYTNGKNFGTRHLCLRTGTAANAVIKYGLTSNSSASQYCPMRLRIDGKNAYIGRCSSSKKETVTTSSISSIYSTKTFITGGTYTVSYPGTITSVFSRTFTVVSTVGSHTIPAMGPDGTLAITSYDTIAVSSMYTYTAETGDGNYTTAAASWSDTRSSSEFVSESRVTGTKTTSYYSLANINM